FEHERSTGSLAAEAVGRGGEEIERRRQELIKMVGPAELEHRHHIDGEALEGERDIDAEIASASAATCPEQIWVLVFVADNQLSCGRDDFGLDHLVAGQTMPPLAEANPSTEHQSGWPFLRRGPLSKRARSCQSAELTELASL